jgi:serine/threonine protein kinase
MEAAAGNGYRVERVLSTRLGVHTVVEAVAADGDRVAITLLDPAVTGDPDLRSHVLDLARTRASIEHPNVLPLIGPHALQDRIGLVSPLGGPRTLADTLESAPLEAEETISLLCQVASALETAAANGLVHRDLAPRAIVLGGEETDRVFLGDFGITLPPLPRGELLHAADSIDYCSPEEVRGEPLEPESNVYSLACILFECLTGSAPYRYDRPLLTLHAHVVEPPPRASTRRPELPDAIDAVLSRAMAKDLRERFRSPGLLMRAAGEALGVEATVPVLVPPRTRDDRAASPRPRHRPRARRGSRPALTRRWVGVALPLAAACGLVAGLIDWSGEPTPRTTAPAPPAAQQARQAVRVDALEDAVGDLAARRARLRGELRQARRPAGQAAAARALAGAYRDARTALPGPGASVPGETRIRAALQETEASYRRLAAAARSRDRRAWAAARRATARSEATLRRALG